MPKSRRSVRYSTVAADVPDTRFHISDHFLWNALLCILAITAVLTIAMGVLVTLYFHQLVDSFIHKEMQLRNGSETFEMWRKPPIHPEMRVYFFNVTNPQEFLLGAKPRLQEVGPYAYRETWEKVNFTWHSNGTLSYETKKIFHFAPDLSEGDESDSVTLLNIPMMTAASQMKHAGKLVRLAMSSMLNVLKQEPFTTHTIKEWLWGYDDPLVKLGKDVMPPENVLPYDNFGLFVGKNGSSDGVFTAFSGVNGMLNYGSLTNWNGKTKMSYWTTAECNQIRGTDGSAFAPDIPRNKTLEIYNPEFCRPLPLVYQKDVVNNGIEAFRFVPHPHTFDSPDNYEPNSCYCPHGPPCAPSGLFNISACKFGSPIAMSWPHFLNADPELLRDVEGLSPDVNKHEFFIDIQPKMGIPLQAKARVQINLMLSRVPDIKQVAGIPDMVFPLFWFESGIQGLPAPVISKLKLATQMPETARSAIAYSLFAFGGILLFIVAILSWKRIRTKSDESTERSDSIQVEYEKRNSGLIHVTNGNSHVSQADSGAKTQAKTNHHAPTTTNVNEKEVSPISLKDVTTTPVANVTNSSFVTNQGAHAGMGEQNPSLSSVSSVTLPVNATTST